MVAADLIDYAHDAPGGDDSRTRDYPVFRALGDDEVVVLGVAADFHDVRRHICKAGGCGENTAERVGLEPFGNGAVGGKLPGQLEILPCKVLVGLSQGKVSAHLFSPSPKDRHDGMGALRDEEILHRATALQHTQCGNLQSHEDCHTDDDSRYFPTARHTG